MFIEQGDKYVESEAKLKVGVTLINEEKKIFGEWGVSVFKCKCFKYMN